MAEAFKIGEGYVLITSRVDDEQIAKDAEEAGKSFGDKLDDVVEERSKETGDKAGAELGDEFSKSSRDHIEKGLENGWDTVGKDVGDDIKKGVDDTLVDAEHWQNSGTLVGKAFGDTLVDHSRASGKASGESWAEEFDKALTGGSKSSDGAGSARHASPEKTGSDALGDIVGGLTKNGSGFGSIPGLSMLPDVIAGPLTSPAGIAILAAAGVSAGAMILSGLSATLIAGLAGGFGLGVIGLGAWLLKDQPDVVKAGNQLKKSLTDTFKDAAQPMVGSFLQAMSIAANTLVAFKPTIDVIFRSLAPAIVPLAQGLAGFVLALAPGLLALSKVGATALISLAGALPGIGKAISDFFIKIQDNWPAIQKSFDQFFNDTANVFGVIVNILVFMAEHYGTARTIFLDLFKIGNMFLPWVQTIYQAFVWLYDVLVGHSVIPDLVNAIVTWFTGLPGKIASALAAMPAKVAAYFTSMASSVESKVSGVVSSVEAKLKTLPGLAGTAVSHLWSSMSSAFTTAASDAKSEAGKLVSGAISELSTLDNKAKTEVGKVKGAVTGAFSGAASWLVSAGENIMKGLINGVENMVGSLKSKLSSITSLIPNIKGPEEVDKKLLTPSGQWIMEGLIAGIDNRIPALANQLTGLTASIPTTVVGAAGTGANAVTVAPTAAPSTIGQVTVHVQGVLDPSDPTSHRRMVIQIRDALDKVNRERQHR